MAAIIGTSGDDTLQGTNLGDAVRGGGGADLIAGLHGRDSLFGESGDDTMSGGPGDDILLGGMADDLLADNDIYSNRFQFSPMPDDRLDTLYGGAGDDLLFAGSGADTFLFNAAEDGADQAFGFESIDTIRLIGFGYANAAEALTHFTQAADGALFDDQGVSILFHAADPAAIEQAPVAAAPAPGV